MKKSLKDSFLKQENYDDKLFYSSLIKELEVIIDNELLKENKETNIDLIDDCCKAIEYLEALLNGEGDALKAKPQEKMIVLYDKNKRVRKLYISAVACAAIAIVCTITAVKIGNSGSQSAFKENKLIYNVMEAFGVYSHTTQESSANSTAFKETSETSSKETTTMISEKNMDAKETSEAKTSIVLSETHSEQGNTGVTLGVINKIDLIFPPDFPIEYKDKSQIDLRDIDVALYYHDGYVETVSVDECEVEISEPDEKGKTKITISFGKGCESFFVTVFPEGEEKEPTLMHLYGTFDGECSVENLIVIAAYTDGSEKIIPKGKYTIEANYSKLLEEEYFTVTYEGLNFIFYPD